MGITRIYNFEVIFKDGTVSEQSIYEQDKRKAKQLAVEHACWGRFGDASDKSIKTHVKKVNKLNM